MKILLDMGHTLSGADTGAEGCGRREQDCTREIGYKVKAKLEALGNTVVVCSKDSCSSLMDSLSYRANTANNAGGDLYLAIHLNAFNGAAYGTEVYTYGGKKFDKAEEVLKNIEDLGYYNRGIKDGSSLYVIKNTSMSAMLIECCFIDNESDMNIYNPEALSDAIVKGITGTTVESDTPSEEVKNKPYEYGIVTASALNVRDSINGNILGVLFKGDTVHIDYVKNDWASIFWGEHGGWICMDYVRPKELYGLVTASTLNVREGNNTNSRVLGELRNGARVRIGFEQDGWYNIYFGDHGGWVSADYVKLQ